jgi:hypothetical protein
MSGTIRYTRRELWVSEGGESYRGKWREGKGEID